MIRITDRIGIAEDEVHEVFLRASGAGGQNVNKVETAVQLRFDARQSPNLTGTVRARLERLAGRRATKDGVIVITAQRHRTQDQNRRDALDRLIALIRKASEVQRHRIATRPTLASKRRRTESKRLRSDTKKLRAAPGHDS